MSARPAYQGVVEHSVYVDRRARGRGVGADLLRALVSSTEAAGVWTIQSAIFPGNAASARLHERLGFRVVGRRERIARLAGQWQDTVLLERRSRRRRLRPEAVRPPPLRRPCPPARPHRETRSRSQPRADLGWTHG